MFTVALPKPSASESLPSHHSAPLTPLLSLSLIPGQILRRMSHPRYLWPLGNSSFPSRKCPAKRKGPGALSSVGLMSAAVTSVKVTYMAALPKESVDLRRRRAKWRTL
ncbi:hypothetical protein FKM82_030993 [Ascaphus truei]